MPDTALDDPSSDDTIRIFISSPGDVAQERVIAERVVERLQGEFARRATLDVIRWEREPLRATEHFQEQITPPAETDISVFILWSRLGTPLPEDKFQKESGEQYRSGTEWEFENAVEAYQETGTPDLVTYRKTKDPEARLSNEEDVEQRLEQKRALESFVEQWFKGEEGESFQAAFHAFESPAEFEQMLETHLRKLIEEHLPERTTESRKVAPDAHWHQGSPFRGLRPFEEEHAPIFFGRTAAVTQIIERLERQAETGSPFVLVHGPSGTGKSSVIKAGVVPTLTRPGVIEGIGHWRQAAFRPSDAPEDLTGGLAQALFRAAPELEETGFTEEELADLLRETPGQAASPLRAGLRNAAKTVAEEEGLPEPPAARVLLTIDQLEEIFTLGSVDADGRAAFAEAIRAITESGLVWTVASIRSDFFPRLSEVGALRDLKQGGGNYDLDPPSFAELGRMIRGPVRAAGLRFEENPDRGIGLGEVLHEAAAEAPEALPLLEFTLEELYRRRTEEDVLTFKAYEELGGLTGAIAERAESVFSGLDPGVQAAFDDVMGELVTIKPGGEESATSRRATMSEVTNTPEKEALADALVEARLLVTGQTDAGEAVLNVAHEALLREWPRLRDWIERNRAFLQTRARVQERAARWDEEGRPDDLLLPTGQPLAEGRGLLEEREEALGGTLRTYIERSIERAERRERRRRRLIGGAVAAFVLVVAGFGLFSYQQWTAAAAERDESLRSQSQYLADQARQQTDEGDPMTGMLLALEALPENLASPSRPFVKEAASALRYSMIRNRELAVFDSHRGQINHLAVMPKGNVAASASQDSTVRLYNLPARKEKKVITHDGPIRHVEFGSNGQLFVATDSTVHVRSVPEGNLKSSFAMRGAVQEVVTGPGGKRGLALLEGGEAVLIDLSSGKTLLSIGGEKRPVRSAAFAQESESLVFAQGGSVRAYDLQSRKTTRLGRGRWADHISVSADGRFVGALIEKNTYVSSVQVWRTENWEKAWTLPVSPVRFQSTPFALGPDGMRIAVIPSRLETQLPGQSTTGRMKSPRVYSLPPNSPDSLQIGPFDTAVQNLAFSPNGSRIIAVTAKGSVGLWNTSTGDPLDKIPSGIPGAEEGIHRAYFAGEGRLALTYSGRSVRLWKATRGPRDVAGRKSSVSSFQLSADGSRLSAVVKQTEKSSPQSKVAVSEEQIAKVSSDNPPTNVGKPRSNQGGRDETTKYRILEVPSAKSVAHFQRLVFGLSPNGRFAALLDAEKQNELVLRDLVNGRKIGRIQIQGSPTVKFGPQGRHVAALSSRDSLVVYDLASETVILKEPGSYGNFGFWRGEDALFARQTYPSDTTRSAQTNVWDLSTGEKIKTMPDILRAGPQNKTLITESDDNEKARIWQSAAKSSTVSVDTLANKAKSLRYRFSGNGRMVVISSKQYYENQKRGLKVISVDGGVKCDHIPIELTGRSFSPYPLPGYKGRYIGQNLNNLHSTPYFSNVISCNSTQLNIDNIEEKYREGRPFFNKTIVSPNGRYIISPLQYRGNSFLSFWRAKDGSYANTLRFNFVKLAPTRDGKGYLVLQGIEDGKRVSEDLQLWQMSPIEKQFTLPGHIGGIESYDRSERSLNIKITKNGNAVSLSSAGRLKVWPLFLEAPQVLTNYAQRQVSRELTSKQRERFHLKKAD